MKNGKPVRIWVDSEFLKLLKEIKANDGIEIVDATRMIASLFRNLKIVKQETNGKATRKVEPEEFYGWRW